MRNYTLPALALGIALSAGLARGTEDDVEADAVLSDVKVPDTGLLVPDAADAHATRRIGELDWHIDYSTAYRQAKSQRKMMILFFRDEGSPRLADVYENEVLTHSDLCEPLANVVRVVVPLDAQRPFRLPEEPGLTLLSHESFQYMYGRQGIAMIDLSDPDSELYGHVVSAHPFTPGRHYTVRGTQIVLGLPPATVTQRALIYAVRLHPAAPISTTEGKCHGYLCRQARQGSKLMAVYGSVGHHDWGTRYAEVAANTGKSASEVAAMSGNPSLIDAAVELVNQWYYSPSHWSIMSMPASIFGYDMVKGAYGGWYGTGVFAY
ncbi:MAG: hypothetical protein ACT4QC_14570 [Planctomycetaceae bacterium]